MKIKELHIAGFGKWVDRSFETDADTLLFFGANEAGKSTLLAFIISMFYGLSPYRGADLARNERIKYKPWQGDYGGSLTFEHDDVTYRIDRRFGDTKRADTTVVTDVFLGRTVALGDQEPGDYFFQRSREEMLHTAVMQQIFGPMEGAQDIQRRWMNTDDSDTASLVEIEGALEEYSKRVDGKGLRKPNQGAVLRQEIHALERALFDAKEQAEHYTQQKKALEALAEKSDAFKQEYVTARDAWMQAQPVQSGNEDAVLEKLLQEQQELRALPIPRIEDHQRHALMQTLQETRTVLQTLHMHTPKETLDQWIQRGEGLIPKPSFLWVLPLLVASVCAVFLFRQQQFAWLIMALGIGCVLAFVLWMRQRPDQARLAAWLNDTGRSQMATDEQRMRRLGELAQQREAVAALEEKKQQLFQQLENAMHTRYFETHQTVDDIQDVLYHDQTLRDVAFEIAQHSQQSQSHANQVSQEDYAQLRQRMRDSETTYEDHKNQVLETEVHLRHLERQLVPPSTVESQLKKKRQALARVEEEQEAITLALQIVQEATAQMAKDRGPRVQQLAQQYLQTLTGEVYTIDIDRHLQVHLRQPGDFARARAYYSAGKQDQIDIALRFAVMDGIYAKQPFALFLDDITERADGARKENILEFITEKARQDNRQLIYFSCHNSVREFFERTGAKIYNIH